MSRLTEAALLTVPLLYSVAATSDGFADTDFDDGEEINEVCAGCHEFVALPPARVRHRLQLEGKEIDLDAYLRFAADRHGGMSGHTSNRTTIAPVQLLAWSLQEPITAPATQEYDANDHGVHANAGHESRERHGRFPLPNPLPAGEGENERLRRDLHAKAVLRFNLVCAHCHEGECSGRLTFTYGPEATFGHIQRFAGNISPDMGLQLYAILEQMKKHCSYVPMPPLSSMSPSEEELSRYRDPESGNYFLPLGPVIIGSHWVSVEFDESSSVRFEIISGEFEPLVDERLQSDGIRKRVDVDEPTNLFLRIRAKNGLLLRAVLVERPARTQ